MVARPHADPVKTREAVRALEDWLRDDTRPAPSRADLAAAVRLTARTLAAQAPGASVEVRVPPFVAVQCISGPGTPEAHRPMWSRPILERGCCWPPDCWRYRTPAPPGRCVSPARVRVRSRPGCRWCGWPVRPAARARNAPDRHWQQRFHRGRRCSRHHPTSEPPPQEPPPGLLPRPQRRGRGWELRRSGS